MKNVKMDKMTVQDIIRRTELFSHVNAIVV